MSANPNLDHPMQLLHDKHRGLLPSVETLQEVADAVGAIPIAALRQRVSDIHAFLSQRLIPHAQAEEQVVYPLVARTLGTVDATSLMGRDHIEIRRLTDELARIQANLSGARLKPADARALRRILYGLSAVLRVHLEEEETYLALLDTRLSPEEARSMLESIEDAERKAQPQAGKTENG